MKTVIHKYSLLSEKQAAALIDCKVATFNYYTKQGLGPEAAWIGPDGRRYYEEETVRRWTKPPRKNAKGEINAGKSEGCL